MRLSISQITTQFGLNASHVKELTHRGVLTVLPDSTPLRPKYARGEVEALQEGEHYVVCRSCGGWAGQLTTKHLQACDGMSLRAYRARWPDAPLLSRVVAKNKAKTEAQRRHQSKAMRKHFLSPEGECTRQKIREASRRLMVTEYREKAAEHLRHLRSDPGRLATLSAETKARWESGELREVVGTWHRENQEKSLASAENARQYVKDPSMRAARAALNKTSKMHLRFKERMIQEGLNGFETEGSVGPFAVDETNFDLRLAVEVDGCYWHGCEECGFEGVASTLSNDKAKNAYLQAAGWRVLRLPGHEVRKNPTAAIERVQEAVASLRRSVA